MRLVKLILMLAMLVVTVLFSATEIIKVVSGSEEPPRITCDQETLNISVNDDEQALMMGISAYDGQDGDLTDKVIVAGISQLITDDTARVTYLVFDSDDNMAQYQRMVRYTDYRKPVITVEAPLVFSTENTAGILEKISAQDVMDGNISERIRLSSLWATDRADIYSLTVMVTNSMGDTARVELPVVVQPELIGRPVINLRKSLIYLDQWSDFDPMKYVASVYVRNSMVPVGDLVVEHQVDTSRPGNYWVTYSYSADGIQGTAVLTVVVQ